MSECILVEKSGHITTVTLNRPEVLNALTVGMLEELDEIFAALDEDKECKVVILTGNGRAFAAGGDISDLGEATRETAMKFSTVTRRLLRRMELARPFTIAAINGYALGGGLELAMACDVRVAAETARMGLTECAVGSFPGSGGTQRLPRLVGLGQAKEIMATAEKVPADKALRIGLVEHVVSPEELMAFCNEIAGRITVNSTSAIAQGKRLMTLSMEMDPDKHAELMTVMIGLNYGTYDQREGMQAFLEKRKPCFE